MKAFTASIDLTKIKSEWCPKRPPHGGILSVRMIRLQNPKYDPWMLTQSPPKDMRDAHKNATGEYLNGPILGNGKSWGAKDQPPGSVIAMTIYGDKMNRTNEGLIWSEKENRYKYVNLTLRDAPEGSDFQFQVFQETAESRVSGAGAVLVGTAVLYRYDASASGASGSEYAGGYSYGDDTIPF